MPDFKDMLDEMGKPELPDLRHKELLEKMIVRGKDKSILNVWWLAIGFYMVAAWVMKSAYVPGMTLRHSMEDYSGRHPYLAVLFFLVIPITITISCLFTLRRIFRDAGRPAWKDFVRAMAARYLTIGAALLLILLYLIFATLKSI